MNGQATVELLTLPAAAKRVGIGVRQVRRAVAEGDLPVYQVGRWPRVRWREVIYWIDSQRASRTPHAKQRVAQILARESRAKSHG
jgi:excisionase family DNA binding protein